MKFSLLLLVTIIILTLIGCGGGEPWCNAPLVGIAVATTAPPIADHNASPPGNQVTFFASPLYGDSVHPCRTHPTPPPPTLQVTWSVSDPGSVSIVSGDQGTPQSTAVATCLRATDAPVTVTASAPHPGDSSVTLKGTAPLTCH